MRPTPFLLFLLLPLLLVGQRAEALEFLADLVMKTDGHTRRASIYYTDAMWRLEHNDQGPVGVTIVRKDMQIIWCLLGRLKHFKSLPYDQAQAPRVTERLDGEVAREEIGSQLLEGHPTTLYEVTAREGAADVVYYQWIATDIHFPLRLTRKDGSWSLEYHHVRLRHLPNELFMIPLAYQPLE